MRLEREYRVAPVSLRLVACLLDTATEFALGAVLVYLTVPAEKWPPRYWNFLDYGVDVFWHQPHLLLQASAILVAVFFFWEVFWARLIGNTPFARLFVMRIVTSSGRRPGLLRLSSRTLVGLLGFFLALVGPAVSIVDPRRRMLHDMLSGCCVLLGRVPPEWHKEDSKAIVIREGTYRDGPFRL